MENLDETAAVISAAKVTGTNVFKHRWGTARRNPRCDDRQEIGQDSPRGASFGGLLGIGQRYHPLPWAHPQIRYPPRRLRGRHTLTSSKTRRLMAPTKCRPGPIGPTRLGSTITTRLFRTGACDYVRSWPPITSGPFARSAAGACPARSNRAAQPEPDPPIKEPDEPIPMGPPLPGPDVPNRLFPTPLPEPPPPRPPSKPPA